MISRTLSYAILTALLVGIFVGIVILTSTVLPLASQVGVTASTLAAAAPFNPLRQRVQRLVDRRFNRARYDADATVAVFTARLRHAIDLETVQSELATAVDRCRPAGPPLDLDPSGRAALAVKRGSDPFWRTSHTPSPVWRGRGYATASGGSSERAAFTWGANRCSRSAASSSTDPVTMNEMARAIAVRNARS